MKRLQYFFIIGLIAFLCLFIAYSTINFDRYGAIDSKGVAHLQIIRYTLGAKIEFDSIERGDQPDSLVLKGRFIGADLLKTETITALVKEASDGGFQTAFSTPLPSLASDASDVHRFIINLYNCSPHLVTELHWVLYFSPTTGPYDVKMELVTPNPTLVPASHNFIVGPTRIQNGDLLMNLKSFTMGPQQTWLVSLHSRGPASLWLKWWWAWWNTKPIKAIPMQWLTLLKFDISKPGWGLVGVRVRSNYSENAGGMTIFKLLPECFGSYLWPDEGPFEITATAIHFKTFSSADFPLLPAPKSNQIIPINKMYSFGKASVRLIAAYGPGSKSPDSGRVFTTESVECQVMKSPFFAYLLENDSGAVMQMPDTGGVLHFVSIPTDYDGIKEVTLVDESRDFRFVASPVMIH